MLTQQEKNELNYEELSQELKLKIDTAFENPDFIVAFALGKQISALCKEMIDEPFTIRGSVQVVLSGKAEGVDLEKEDQLARARAETAIKVLKELPDLNARLKVIQQTLSPDEKNDLSKKTIVTASDLKGVAFVQS